MPKQLRILSAMAVLLGAFNACRQSRQGSIAAADVAASTNLVAEYLARDSRGERLRPAPWFHSVSAWEDEPGWDAITLIRSYSIGHNSIHGDSARIEVTYDVIGSLEGTPRGTPMRLVPQRETQRVEFVLAKARGHWLVAYPSINPHVRADSILTYSPDILGRKQAVLLDSLLQTNH